MAKRALETFIVALAPKGKRVFQKDELVPDEFAKDRDGLVYDDGAAKGAVSKDSRSAKPKAADR